MKRWPGNCSENLLIGSARLPDFLFPLGQRSPPKLKFLSEEKQKSQSSSSSSSSCERMNSVTCFSLNLGANVAKTAANPVCVCVCVCVQMSVRRCRRRRSLSGWTLTCPECPAGSQTCTWTWGTDACSSNCWRFCQERDWYCSVHSEHSELHTELHMLPVSIPQNTFFTDLLLWKAALRQPLPPLVAVRGAAAHLCRDSLVFLLLCFCAAAEADQRPDAYSLSGERGQGSAVPEGAEGSPGEHGLPRHCGRKPPTDAGTHLDHHPPLPGNHTHTEVGWSPRRGSTCSVTWLSGDNEVRLVKSHTLLKTFVFTC